jgi:leucyl aminopeptidase
MKKLWMICALALTSQAAMAKDIYVTIGTDAVQSSTKSISNMKALDHFEGISVMKMDEKQVENLSKMMHDKFHRCGGFVVHDSKKEALKVLGDSAIRKMAKSAPLVDYTITEGVTTQALVSQVKEISIRSTIEKLSSFHNRYYKSQTGLDSQAWIKGQWELMSEGRADVSVEYFKHKNFPQPSVILTITGTEMADDIIVVGGHADSIAGYWGRERARAPGADDNASGIATTTEAIRVLMETGHKPKRTVKFMAYAAEEVGLLGSKDIANSFKAAGKKVVGVMQLDMTNHNGTADKDIVFMTDFTNKAQNEFLGRLIDTYVKVPWGYSKCGYGCSDHASWHNAGYPASIPFESTMGDINGKIHTKNDTIQQSGSHAQHAEKFAKLAVSFIVELGK